MIILDLLGTPRPSETGWEGEAAVKFLKKQPFRPPKPVSRVLDRSLTSSAGCSFLNGLVRWLPAKRMTASQALRHEFLVVTHMPPLPVPRISIDECRRHAHSLGETASFEVRGWLKQNKDGRGAGSAKYRHRTNGTGIALTSMCAQHRSSKTQGRRWKDYVDAS